MLSSAALLVFASSFFSPATSAPHEQRSHTTSNQTVYSIKNTTEYTRANPTYNATQLLNIKTAMTSNERLRLIRSYGDTDLYFKYDFSPSLEGGNAGAGQGGQGILANVQNYPVLLGTGLSVAMGFLGPCKLFSRLDRKGLS